MYKSFTGILNAVLLYGLLISNSHAGLVLYGAITDGGDTLISSFDDEGSESADLKAGGLFHMAIGYESTFSEAGGFRITYGYKSDKINADNGDASISRWPLEIVLYSILGETRRHRVGGGLVYEMLPEFEVDVADFGDKIEFDNASGFMIYYGYLTDSFEWGLRYTDIEFENEFVSGIDASNYGLYMNWNFE
jgi:hypothetical protein